MTLDRSDMSPLTTAFTPIAAGTGSVADAAGAPPTAAARNHRGASGGAFAAETVTRLADIERMRAEWVALEQVAPGHTQFQTHGFVSLVASALADAGTPADLSVLALRAGDRLVAVWPLRRFRLFGLRFLGDLAQPFGQYSDALIDPAIDRERALDALLAAARASGAEGLFLRKVREDAAIHPRLARDGVRLGTTLHAPFVALSGFASHDAYLATRPAKMRKQLRSRRRGLEAAAAVRRVTLDAGPAFADLVRRTAALRRDWLDTRGETSSAFADPAFPAFIEGIASGRIPGLGARVNALLHRGPDGVETPVSLQINFAGNGVLSYFMTGKTTTFDAYGPGLLHLDETVAAAIAEGLAEVDMQVPDMPYKAGFATGRVAVADYGLAFTRLGRLVLDGWYGGARPRLRKAFGRLPPALRRRLVGTKGPASPKGEED